MNKNKLAAILIILVVSVGLSSVILISLNQNRAVTYVLYPESATVVSIVEETSEFALSQITYEMNNIPGANATNFGSIDDLTTINDVGIGLTIDWSDCTESFVTLIFVFNVPSEYTEKFFDLNPRVVFTITHPGEFSYTLSVVISQIQFSNETIDWDFQRHGAGTDSAVVDVDSSVIDSTWYNAVNDEGYFRPNIQFFLPIDPTYTTTIEVDYVSVDVV